MSLLSSLFGGCCCTEDDPAAVAQVKKLEASFPMMNDEGVRVKGEKGEHL